MLSTGKKIVGAHAPNMYIKKVYSSYINIVRIKVFQAENSKPL